MHINDLKGWMFILKNLAKGFKGCSPPCSHNIWVSLYLVKGTVPFTKRKFWKVTKDSVNETVKTVNF